ncbi:snaclec echicetin subunit beta-like [Mytilus edulis]|uniref:snaclec echicetin subunit beta-like n=1 Tax=Mytilus edulis TaxID=6550 RepID=UPI0039F03ED0
MITIKCMNIIGQFTCSDPDWSLFGANCYKIESKFNYADATQKCHDFGGYVIMPKTEVEMNYFKNLRNAIAEEVWIGLKEINSNGIWIWADGFASDQGIVIDADDFADCARLKDDGNVWDIHCSNIFMTICQRDANLEASTKVSTTKEPVSSTDSETKFVPENLSTALKVSSHVSPVYSKTTAQHVSTALKVSSQVSPVYSKTTAQHV